MLSLVHEGERKKRWRWRAAWSSRASRQSLENHGTNASPGGESPATEGTALLAPRVPRAEPAALHSPRASPCPAATPQRHLQVSSGTNLTAAPLAERALLPSSFSFTHWLTSKWDSPHFLGYKKPSALGPLLSGPKYQCILVSNCSQVLAACRAEEHLWTWPQLPKCSSHGGASALSEQTEPQPKRIGGNTFPVKHPWLTFVPDSLNSAEMGFLI